jgi:hypothetical protein
MNEQLTMANFNDFLTKANMTLSCDSECQKNKNILQLKQKYLDAQTNVTSASAQEQIAYKNYIVYSEGTGAYNDKLVTKLREKANIISDTYTKQFEENFKNTEILLGTYEGLLTNFNNIVDLYVNYTKENIKFINNNKIKISDIQTNHRKTFYEDQNIDRLKLINNILFYLFYLILILFIVFSFIYPSNYSISYKIVIVFLLGLYPFISTTLFLYFVKLYNVLHLFTFQTHN